MAHKKSWTVVKFDDDASVAAVPTVWITNDSCLWPPFSAEKLNAAIKNQKIDTCWPSHRIQVFRNATYDSYEIARKKARKAEDTSDLNTDVENSQQQRKVLKRKFVSSSDDSGSEIDALKNVPMPSPPVLERSRRDDHQTFMRTDDSDLIENTREDLMSGEDVAKSIIPTAGYKPKCQCDSQSHAKFQAELLRQIHFLKSICMEMMTEIKNLKRNSNIVDSEASSQDVDSILSKFKCPIASEEEFNNLEEVLKNNDDSKKLESEVLLLGGTNLCEFVRRSLGFIISDSVAVKYSWLGRREKKPFCHLGCASVVINAALRSRKCGDKRQAEVEIGRWLRRARDRLKSMERPKVGV